MIKVFGVCAFPKEFPCTRYRLLQFVEPLREQGIELEVRPFLESEKYAAFYDGRGGVARLLTLVRPLLRRFRDIKRARECDVILVQREAMLFGPAFFERLYRVVGSKPMILDLDDAVYIPYLSPKYGKIGSFLKFFGKTDSLIRQADVVVCGGRYLSEYARNKGANSVVIPTVVDTDKFHPVKKNNAPMVIGWIGTESTFPFLESIFPVLQRLADRYDFLLRIRGSGKDRVEIDGVKVENLPWSLETEIADFQSFDIGLYPLKIGDEASLEWIQGKSGFKAIQYLSLGLPFVMSPIGVCAEMGIPNETHFLAESETDWEEKLTLLLEDKNLRIRMGDSGRKFSLKEYSLEGQAQRLARVITEVVSAKDRETD